MAQKTAHSEALKLSAFCFVTRWKFSITRWWRLLIFPFYPKTIHECNMGKKIGNMGKNGCGEFGVTLHAKPET